MNCFGAAPTHDGYFSIGGKRACGVWGDTDAVTSSSLGHRMQSSRR